MTDLDQQGISPTAHITKSAFGTRVIQRDATITKLELADEYGSDYKRKNSPAGERLIEVDFQLTPELNKGGGYIHMKIRESEVNSNLKLGQIVKIGIAFEIYDPHR